MNNSNTVQGRNYKNLHTQPRQLVAKFISGLTPALFWLLKDLPCAICSQPVPLVRQNQQNQKYKNIFTKINKEASPQVQFQSFSNILLCSACTAALAPCLRGYCQFCALPFPAGSQSFGPCADCMREKPSWQHIYFLAAYEGLLKELLINLKFQNELYAARILGKLLAQRIHAMQTLQNVQANEAQKSLFAVSDTNNPTSPDTSLAHNLSPDSNNFSCVIPVPLSSQRLRERGYNQSLEIARVVAKELHLPLEYTHLLRIKHGMPQEQMNKKERFKAVKGMFAVPAQQNVSNRHVLLLDDIMTTGATIQECTRILLTAGAKAVSVAVVARTPLE